MSLPNPAPAMSTRPLRRRELLRFQLPLAANAWLMALAGPALNVALGRAAEPRLQLAAFWLAFAVVLVCQSACGVLPQAVAGALGRGQRPAAVGLGAALVGVLSAAAVLALACTPLGGVLFGRLVPGAARTAALARATLAPMAALPPLVALRGVAAGAALRARRTAWLAAATAVRVLALAGMGLAVIAFGASAGAVAAAWALVLATAAEAVWLAAAAWLVAGPGAGAGEDAAPLGAPAAAAPLASPAPFLALVLPLAAATAVWTLERPLVAGVLGRLADPELALAGLGVALPVLLLGCAPLWSFADAALVLPRDGADLRRLVRYAAEIALAFALALAAVALTPLGPWLVARAFALPPALARAVAPALAWVALEPCVLAARALAQGLLVRAGRTGRLLALSTVKLPLLLAGGLALAHAAPHANGAALALALFVGGDALDAALLGLAAARASRGRGAAARPAREEAA